jgi:glucose/arabinose dehydrogenase
LVGAVSVAVLVVSGLSAATAVSAPPLGFDDALVARVPNPIGMAFTPDGRLLVTTQAGRVHVVAGGTLLADPAIDLSARVCTDREWGLGGVAVHPQFAQNRFVYLYYTFKKSGTCDFQASTSPVNRLSRFVLGDDNVIDPSSEAVLLDNIPSPEGVHNGGDLKFGKDGNLYVSVGDGGCDYKADSGCYAQNDASRDQNVLLGKILRVTPAGGIPSDNPWNGPGSARCNTGPAAVGVRCQETYAWGLRNPFRFAFDPGAVTNRFFINDVGQDTWEEVNLGIAGADYGWNVREGQCRAGSTTDCGPPPGGMSDPIFSYSHSGGCKAVTGGAFVPAGVWPSEWDGAYVYSDYVCGKMFKLTPSGSGYASSEFVSDLGAGSAIMLLFGPSGGGQALYYTTYANGGEIRKIEYVGAGNRTPTARATASPSSGPLPLDVTFDASESSDPDDEPLTYVWNFGDGSPSVSTSAPVVTHRYERTATFTPELYVVDSSGVRSETLRLRVDPGRRGPSVQIDVPTAAERFAVGETITLRGSAVDPEDGALPSSALTWEVLLQHDDHVHPYLQPTMGNDLQIVAPQPESLAATKTSWLIVKLTARDSDGLTTMVTQLLKPNLVEVTVGTSPSGVPVTVNGTTVASTTALTSWEGFRLTLVAPGQATVGGTTVFFQRWSDNSTDSTRVVVTPRSAASYFATYGDGSGGGTTTAAFGVAAGSDDGDVERGSSAYPPGAGATPFVGTGDRSVLVRRSQTPYPYIPVRTGLLRFDTSSLPDDATVTSAELRLYVTGKADADGRSLRAEWYPSGNWPIDAADWALADSGSAHAGTALASIVVGQEKRFALTGLGELNLRGASALRLHISDAGVAPSGANDLAFAAFEDPTLPEPQLIVRYTSASGAGP